MPVPVPLPPLLLGLRWTLLLLPRTALTPASGAEDTKDGAVAEAVIDVDVDVCLLLDRSPAVVVVSFGFATAVLLPLDGAAGGSIPAAETGLEVSFSFATM